MRRLLLSVGLAVLAGGIAVAVNADQPFGDRRAGSEPSSRQVAADGPRAISNLPLVEQPTPGRTANQGTTEKEPGTPVESAWRPEELLVKFKPSADPTVVADRHGATIVSNIPQIGIYVLAVAPGTQAAAQAALSADPDVEYAEPNGVMRAPELPATADPCDPSPTAP